MHSAAAGRPPKTYPPFRGNHRNNLFEILFAYRLQSLTPEKSSKQEFQAALYIWVCLKIVYPIVPNGFHDHYPYEKWLAIIGNIPNIFRQTHISLVSMSTCRRQPGCIGGSTDMPTRASNSEVEPIIVDPPQSDSTTETWVAKLGGQGQVSPGFTNLANVIGMWIGI